MPEMYLAFRSKKFDFLFKSFLACIKLNILSAFITEVAERYTERYTIAESEK
jgi:hypothetical protein